MSTEGGRESRFPRPEVEIQFSTLQPNTFNLRRQGDAHSTTVKVTKRKSVEMVSVLCLRVGHPIHHSLQHTLILKHFECLCQSVNP